MLWLGLLPAASVPAAWRQLAGWGLEGFGDYGAFVFLGALAAFYLFVTAKSAASVALEAPVAG